MGALKIKVNADAINSIEAVAEWYRVRMGESAAQNFVDGIYNTIDLLAKMPTIGRCELPLSTFRRKYYSFLSHPRYRVVYRYTKTMLYIVAIQATAMKH